jgi:sterol desaturase/sphingolipid hydroxylase (fatty acid hydroxylase superfamily)
MVLPTVTLVALALIAVERLAPGRFFPRKASWLPRALALNAVQVLVVWAAGSLWDGWMLARRPFSADGLGLAGSTLVGYFVVTFVYYWWHRWRHESPFLWRAFHQVHHSVERVEILASFYKHPLEVLVNGLLSSAILYLACGLGRDAAVLAVTLTGLAELVYHWNVRTPYWLGFLFQRPESHCVHHQLGHHTQNFADLPLWDMLFGTFHNPRAWSGATGFGAGREERLLAMLCFEDVNR